MAVKHATDPDGQGDAMPEAASALRRRRGDQGVSVNGGTMSLHLDGIEYQLELSAEEARQLRAELRPWTSRARVVGRSGRDTEPGPRRRPATTRIDRLQLAKIRQWARQNGLPVSPRGRVPEAVQRAFSDAHA